MSDDLDGGPHRLTAKALLVSAVAAIGGFLFGFDTAVIHGAVDAIRHELACALVGSAIGA